MLGLLPLAPQWINEDFFILIDLSLQDLFFVVFKHFSFELLLSFSLQVKYVWVFFGSIGFDDIGSLIRKRNSVFLRVDFLIMVFEVNEVRKLVGLGKSGQEMLIER